MKYEHQLITPEGVAEGDLNGEDVYEIHLTDGTILYADKHLTESHLRLDHSYFRMMVSVFACTDGGAEDERGYGISQIYINVHNIVKIIPLEISG